MLIGGIEAAERSQRFAVLHFRIKSAVDDFLDNALSGKVGTSIKAVRSVFF